MRSTPPPLPRRLSRRALLARLGPALALWIPAACASAPSSPIAPPYACGVATTVIVVRHAERADDGASRDPELSAAGQQRAQALAEALQHAGVEAILVTQFRRTRQTAEPLARILGVSPEVLAIGPGGLEAHVAAVTEAVQSRHAGRVVLLVGHSNTVPAIARALSGHPVPEMREDEYGTLYVVTLPPVGSPGGQPRLFRASWSTRGVRGSTLSGHDTVVWRTK